MMSIFLSYCHKNKAIADLIDKALQTECGIIAERDERDVGPWNSFSEFMEQAGTVDIVMPIISGDYLKSRNCMYEALETIRDRKYNDKIFPIVLEDDIYNRMNHIQYVKFWQEKSESFENELDGIRAENLGPLGDELKFSKNIAESMAEFLSVVTDRNNPSILKGMERVTDFVKERLGLEKDTEIIKEEDKDYFEEYGIEKKRLPKHFTDLEKEEFVRASYRDIIAGLSQICDQYTKEDGIVKIKTKKRSDNSFVISIYSYGNKKKALQVGYCDQGTNFGMLGIYTSDSISNSMAYHSGKSYNGLYLVETDNNELILNATLSFLATNKNMHAKDVVVDIWKCHIEPYIT